MDMLASFESAAATEGPPVNSTILVYSTAIAACESAGKWTRALEIALSSQAACLCPDSSAFSVAIRACLDANAIEAHRVFSLAVKKCAYTIDPCLFITHSTDIEDSHMGIWMLDLRFVWNPDFRRLPNLTVREMLQRITAYLIDTELRREWLQKSSRKPLHLVFGGNRQKALNALSQGIQPPLNLVRSHRNTGRLVMGCQQVNFWLDSQL